MKERITELSSFIGLREYEDTTKASPNSARKMVNMMLTDRGGLSKRPGVSILGSFDTTDTTCSGFTVFRKTDSITEIPIKAFKTGVLKYYHPDYANWDTLKTGYTTNSDFGFVHGFVRSGNDDYIYYGNKYEPDTRWNGIITQLDGALVGAETSVVVDSVLRPDIYDTKTATASSATTFDVSGTPWASNQWINFYVYVKAGTHIGKIRKITATTTNQITFDTLGSDPGLVEFEIRFAKFPATGTIIYNGTTIAYTAIPEYNKLTVASAHAGSDNAPVALVPTEYVGNPRGNRMAVLRGRRYVGNVRSGLNYNASAGFAQPGAVYVSKVVNGLYPDNDLTDFTLSDPRVAGDGDIIAGEYGGEGHTDVVVHNDQVYMFKPKAIESVAYSQDTADLPVIAQPSTTYGSIMRTIKAQDDVYMVTSDKQFTSLGRVLNKDATETSLNIGLPVKRLLQSYGYDANSQGGVYRNRIHIPTKADPDDTATNRLLIYNLNGAFEGEWWLSVDKMDLYQNELYASLSNSPNVIKLYDGYNDKLGASTDDDYEYPISSEYLSNYINLTKSGFNQQEVNLFACEGYILGNTKITFKLYKDLEESPFLSFDFQGTDDQVDTSILSSFLGSLPLGIEPLGAISTTTDLAGRKHFMFIVYFPFEHAEWVSWGFTNSGLNQDFEILRAGMNFKEDTIFDFGNRIKSIT